jgi:hypothetical protein
MMSTLSRSLGEQKSPSRDLQILIYEQGLYYKAGPWGGNKILATP